MDSEKVVKNAILARMKNLRIANDGRSTDNLFN
jgi:hypothetical protein